MRSRHAAGAWRLQVGPVRTGRGTCLRGPIWVARAAGGADDAAIARTYGVGRTAAGGTTALSDALKYRSACSRAAIEQASSVPVTLQAAASSATPHKMSRSDTSTASSA